MNVNCHLFVENCMKSDVLNINRTKWVWYKYVITAIFDIPHNIWDGDSRVHKLNNFRNNFSFHLKLMSLDLISDQILLLNEREIKYKHWIDTCINWNIHLNIFNYKSVNRYSRKIDGNRFRGKCLFL